MDIREMILKLEKQLNVPKKLPEELEFKRQNAESAHYDLFKDYWYDLGNMFHEYLCSIDNSRCIFNPYTSGGLTRKGAYDLIKQTFSSLIDSHRDSYEKGVIRFLESYFDFLEDLAVEQIPGYEKVGSKSPLLDFL